MELHLQRVTKTAISTVGILTIDKMHECYILEDVERGLNADMRLDEIMAIKVHGKTAIPRGRYEVIISWSNRFQQQMPLLLNVPGYAGIRIHPGNTAGDTEGCLLPGFAAAVNKVLQSRLAYNALLTKLKKALKTGKVFITIE